MNDEAAVCAAKSLEESSVRNLWVLMTFWVWPSSSYFDMREREASVHEVVHSSKRER